MADGPNVPPPNPGNPGAPQPPPNWFRRLLARLRGKQGSWIGLYLVLLLPVVVHLIIVLWPPPVATALVRDTLGREAARLELMANAAADSVQRSQQAIASAADTVAARSQLVAREAELARLRKRAAEARSYVDSIEVITARAAIDAQDVRLFGVVTTRVTLDVRLILLALALGALGSFVHAAQSLTTYIGNGTFCPSWSWFYVLRPFIGAALAGILYFAIRGALFPSSLSTSGDVSPYGVAALATLAGMFSKQATDKLDEVFSTLFRTGPGAGDAARADKVDSTKPTITAVSPSPAKVVEDRIPISITGSGFVAQTVAFLGGKQMETKVIDPTKLEASIAANDLTVPGSFDLIVSTTKPDGTVLASSAFALVVVV